MDYLNKTDGLSVQSMSSWMDNLKLIHFGVETALRRSSEEMIKYAMRKRINYSF
jgi:hypothetical protein